MRPKENPFNSTKVESIPYLLGNESSWQKVLDDLERLNFRACVTGPHGSGKTTFLEHLAEKLVQQGYLVTALTLNLEQPMLSSEDKKALIDLTKNEIVLIDGAELLSIHQWQALRWRCRKAKGLVITMHRKGRFKTLIRCSTSVPLLQTLINRLAPDENIPAEKVEDLFHRHKGNLRNALRELSDMHSNPQNRMH